MYHLPNLHQYQVSNLNRPKTLSEIEAAIKISQLRIFQGGIVSVQNATRSLRRVNTNTPQSIPWHRNKMNIEKLILWGHSYPNTQSKEGHSKDWELQTNFSLNIDAKILSTVFALNSVTYQKDDPPWSRFHHRDVGMFQHV